MQEESFGLAALASFLKRDARELEKLAERGQLPGKRIAGQWRFHRAEVSDWVAQGLTQFTDHQLVGLEQGMQSEPAEDPTFLLSDLMSVETTAVPLDARTSASVLPRLVDVANANWEIYEPSKIVAALRAREALASTALPGGVAVPHPRRPDADALAHSLIAYGRTLTGIPFGGSAHQLTDIFFLILCQDERSHLRVLARLGRLLQREGFLDRLRDAETAVSTLAVIREYEAAVAA